MPPARPVRLAALLVAGVVMVATLGCATAADSIGPWREGLGPVLGHRDCRAARGLPDPRCTPGAVDPRVTPDTLGTTICRAGWTRSVRPPVSVTEPIKRERLRAYGLAGSRLSAFELDHLVPLELGGAPSAIANLWPEAYAGPRGARVKDLVENALRRRVCARRLGLRAAQQAIATDWTAALARHAPVLPIRSR